MITGSKAIEILNKRLSTINAEIATAENNARLAVDRSSALNKLKLELIQAVTILQNNFR